MNGHFTKDGIWIANKHVKRCFTLSVIGEMSVNNTAKCPYIPRRMAWIFSLPQKSKQWNLTIPSVGEDAEQMGLSDVAGGTVKWCNHFGKQFDSFLEVKHISTIWPAHSTSRCLLKRNKDLCPLKYLYLNGHGRFIHNSQKPWKGGEVYDGKSWGF